MSPHYEIPKYCNYYEIAVAADTVTVHFFNKNELPKPETFTLLSSLVFDKLLFSIFLSGAHDQLKRG